MPLQRSKTQIALIGLAGCWLLFCCGAAFAQREQLTRLEGQVQTLDQQQRTAALDLEKRLTRLETTLDLQGKVLWGVAGSVGLLVLETGVSVLMRRRRES